LDPHGSGTDAAGQTLRRRPRDARERTGTPLHRYANTKSVTNLNEWDAAQRRAEMREQAAQDVEIEEARHALRGEGLTVAVGVFLSSAHPPSA
jgi:hypothetical protein